MVQGYVDEAQDWLLQTKEEVLADAREAQEAVKAGTE